MYVDGIGDLVEALRRFDVAGFDRKLLQRINRNQTLADRMFAASQVDPAEFRFPDWWEGYEAQMEEARQRYPGVEIPEPPQIFVPWTMTEIPLLHVQCSFEEMLAAVPVPDDWAPSAIAAEVVIGNMRGLASGMGYSKKRAVWLGFDYASYPGVAPQAIPLRPRKLAGREIFSALTQFPGWLPTWQKTNPSSDFLLSGWRYRDKFGESMVPALSVISNHLRLVGREDNRHYHWQFSPTVRLLQAA